MCANVSHVACLTTLTDTLDQVCLTSSARTNSERWIEDDVVGRCLSVTDPTNDKQRKVSGLGGAGGGLEPRTARMKVKIVNSLPQFSEQSFSFAMFGNIVRSLSGVRIKKMATGNAAVWRSSLYI
jgi:hypothetical protein